MLSGLIADQSMCTCFVCPFSFIAPDPWAEFILLDVVIIPHVLNTGACAGPACDGRAYAATLNPPPHRSVDGHPDSWRLLHENVHIVSHQPCAVRLSMRATPPSDIACAFVGMQGRQRGQAFPSLIGWCCTFEITPPVESDKMRCVVSLCGHVHDLASERSRLTAGLI